MTRPRGGYSSTTGHYTESFHERQTNVYESTEQRPVLYDAKGTPLVRAKRPLGFQPPERKETP